MTPERWQRVTALYHGALMRPERDRAAFLKDACRDDESLRAVVESLLHQPSSVWGPPDALLPVGQGEEDVSPPPLSGRR